MSFDINTLNGVHFDAGSFALITGSHYIGTLNGPSNPPTSFHVYADGRYSTERYDVQLNQNGYTVQVLSNTYSNANVLHDSGGYYWTPEFGVIKLIPDGLYTLDAYGNQVLAHPIYAAVGGFNANQILLTYTHFDLSQISTYRAGAIFTGYHYVSGHQLGYGLGAYNGPGVALHYHRGTNFVLSDTPISGQFTTTFYDTLNASVTFVPPTPACFAEGTKIATLRGDVAVEELEIGDEVLTESGETRPAIWIGSRKMRTAAYPNPEQIHPILVRAGAFGDGLPSRDLRLSPGHAVYIDGVLVPVSCLVNGATIVQEKIEHIRYFHVELDAHDVLYADGLPCESYLDDGNRDVFANSPEHTDLYGRLDPVDWDGACAPVLRDWEKDHAALTAIRAKLHAHAEELGWHTTADANVKLIADSKAIEQLHEANNRLWFQLPAGSNVKLVSRAARPFDTIPGNLDTRMLGIAVSELRVDGQAIALDSAAFSEGFMGVETDGRHAWRWTGGEAQLSIHGPALVEIGLHMTALAWQRPRTALRLVEAG